MRGTQEEEEESESHDRASGLVSGSVVAGSERYVLFSPADLHVYVSVCNAFGFSGI